MSEAAAPFAVSEPSPAAAPSSISLVPEADLIAPPLEPMPPEPAPLEPAPIEVAAVATPDQVAIVPEAGPASAEDQAAANAATASSVEKKSEESGFYEVWRPGGRSERRPHRPRRQPRPQLAAAPAAPPEAPASVAAAPAESPAAPMTSEAAQPPRKDGQQRHERQQRMERQAKSFGQRPERQAGGPPRGARPPRRDKGDRVERAEREQYYAKPHGSGSDRNKAPDPNSPFAKLAALKQQLEQNSKDRP
jgi:ATP-dependent RNA helicase SUPV3L1/SUV3